jgi:hypothetical protein
MMLEGLGQLKKNRVLYLLGFFFTTKECLPTLLGLLDSYHYTLKPLRSRFLTQGSAAVFSASQAQHSVTQSACDLFQYQMFLYPVCLYTVNEYNFFFFAMALPAHSGPRPLTQFRNHFSQTVGLLGRVISPSQGRYLNTGQHKHRINAYTKRPCPESYSNPRSQRPS